MRMRGSSRWSWAWLSCLALVGWGCGYDPFAAPARSKSRAPIAETGNSKVNFLVLVVPAQPKGDLEVWGLRAQHEANDKRAVFRIMGPTPEQTAADQPLVIGKAVADGASALLVYPGDSPGLPGALAEAQAKGIPVVLIDKEVAAPEGSKPFTVVTHGPFESTAGRIVAATIDDLKKASRPTNGTAILLVDRVADSSSARRVAALKAAAEAAKFRQVVTATFDGADQDSARKVALEAIKANPDVSVILADDAEGMMGAAVARVESKGNPVFFVGGYSDYRTSTIVQPPTQESCYVEGRYSELGGLAVVTALAKLRGEDVGDHVYLTPKFTKSLGLVATPGEQSPPGANGLQLRTPSDEEKAARRQ